MNDERLRSAYEAGLRRHGDSASLDDVAAERLRRLVEREGGDEERLRTLDTLLSSAEGRRELEIAWAAAKAARPPRRTWHVFAAAASLALVVGVSAIWWSQRTPTPDVLRSIDSPITLVAPLGEVSDRPQTKFVWRALPDAERYTLVVVDATGAEVYARETQDTSLVLSDSVRLTAGRAYLWWVQARRSGGATVTAVTQRLLVR